MKANYYDPVFYVCSEKMPFTIRIEMVLKEKVRGDALTRAVERASVRYPYFSMRIAKDGEEYLSVPNDTPLPVYPGPEVLPLGGAELHGHLVAVSYFENEIYFYASHAVTDGGGFGPFLKTVLYEYFCGISGRRPDPAGITMADSPIFPDETGNPFPEDKMAAEEPFSLPKKTDFFRLRDGGYVRDSESTVYRLRIPEDEVMRCNFDNDASPCALLSVLMTKAIWAVHPELEKDIVSAVSFNMRPGLGNRHSWRMLSSALRLNYPAKMKNASLTKLCTCTRGMVMVQSQPENVLYQSQKRRELVESLDKFPTIVEKMNFIGPLALADSVDNTFSISYVGKFGPNCIEDFLDANYNVTDGSTWQTVFLEVTAIGGWFDVAFLQGFSSDVYYRAFLEQLRQQGLSYREDGVRPLKTPKIILP